MLSFFAPQALPADTKPISPSEVTEKNFQVYRNSEKWKENVIALHTTDEEMEERWARSFASIRKREKYRKLSLICFVVAALSWTHLIWRFLRFYSTR